jgi:hypothetical protein
MAASAVAADSAVPGAAPECTATAQKRCGYIAAMSAAMPAPADRPATATRAGSTGCRRATLSMAASSVAASAAALPLRRSNQFQQPWALATRSCSG